MTIKTQYEDVYVEILKDIHEKYLTHAHLLLCIGLVLGSIATSILWMTIGRI